MQARSGVNGSGVPRVRGSAGAGFRGCGVPRVRGSAGGGFSRVRSTPG